MGLGYEYILLSRTRSDLFRWLRKLHQWNHLNQKQVPNLLLLLNPRRREHHGHDP
jgi:hypothetical protein